MVGVGCVVYVGKVFLVSRGMYKILYFLITTWLSYAKTAFLPA